MSYLRHAIQTAAGVQPAVVDTAYFDYNVTRPAGARYKMRVDANLLGNITPRSHLRGIAYVGELVVSNSANNQSATAVGGFYDPLIDFLTSPDGHPAPPATYTVTEAQDIVIGVLQSRYLVVQTFGGRLVAT